MNKITLPNAADVQVYMDDIHTTIEVEVPKTGNRLIVDTSSSNSLSSKFLEEIFDSSKQTRPTYLETQALPEEIIKVRDIPIDQIKKEMLSLMSDSKTRWADEIAEELSLDIKDVIEAFKQLQEEGKLFIDENKL